MSSPSSLPPLRIALAGLGTVGGGVASILAREPELIAARCGRTLTLVAVSARDKAKAQSLPLSGVPWVADAAALADLPDVDVVIEAIGGSEGVARTLVERALSNGKSVVTANKALIAHHGLELARLAEARGALLAFEAAVAGGIPIIKGLRDGLAANRFTRVAGILNGTCNYILTRMREDGASFEDVLAQAQALGYAEAEPSFDVDGIDTAHKLAILSSLAFGCAPAIAAVHVEGIRSITLEDMRVAEMLGYRIKLLGIAEKQGESILQRVHPCMVPVSSPLANVHDVYNAVAVEGDSVGKVFFEGRGAGAGPTASSVVADVMDIARGTTYRPFTLPVSALASAPLSGMSRLVTSYYMRLSVTDKPGVLADVTGIFQKEGISVRSFLQHSRSEDEPVQVVLTTHATPEANMNRAVAAISGLRSVQEPPHLIRIEE